MDARPFRLGLLTLLPRRDDAGRSQVTKSTPGPGRRRRGPVRTIAPHAVAIGALVGMTAVATSPALAAGPAVSIAVTSSPNPVSSGAALAYTVTVVNTGGGIATGLTISDSLNGVGPGADVAPETTNPLGACSWASPTVTCTASSLGAGQTWTVTITGAVTAAAGSTISDTASVTGTESSISFNASASTTVEVSQILPPGFVQTQLAGGLANPIVLAFAPNGDIYVGEKSGTILIYRSGAMLATPLGTIPNVWNNTESGLLGLALDPNYATNGFIYVSYVVLITDASGAQQPFSRLSRFTVVNGAIDTSTEKVYYQGNQVQNGHHPGQTVKIGPDGRLWWSVGDNVPSITNARTLTNIYGKMLRFNLDGSVPTDNPFLNIPNAVPYIYAYGLRNPFRWSFLPTGRAITEDTGSSYWEELDSLQPGANYGWDIYEGSCFTCDGVNPVYAYGHLPVDGAASAVAAYTGSTFPSAYDHVVFVGDYNRGTIDAVTFDPTYTTATSDVVFDSAVGTIADLEEGPDGNLYYVGIFEGRLWKISSPGPFVPTASATSAPSAGPTPFTAQFSSAGSSDPYGRTLTYSWNFGDGSGSTSANPSHTYMSKGTFTATLTVSNGSTSALASTNVVAGQSPPSASITAPTTYNAGQTVAFSGTATDAVDGTEPGSAYSWKVDFYSNGVLQPSYYAEVPYPFYGPLAGVPSGSFQVPTDPSQTPNSFYRITLTVTDSVGLQTVVAQDLHPNTTSWSANTSVPGTGYAVDGTWHTGSYSTTDVVGTRHQLTGQPLAQTVGGVRYRFAGFADGSALTDTVTGGSGSGSYTANYDQVTSTMPAPWQSADVGSPITHGRADYGASSSTFYLDGSGSDVYGSNEQFQYVYQTLSGDGTIVARIRYQSNSNSWAKAGVMIAQSTSPGTAYVDAEVTPDVSGSTPNINGVGCTVDGCLSPVQPVTPAMGNGAHMQYSTTGFLQPAAYPPGFNSPNKWLKLQRSGNTFTSWLSADGSTWTQIRSVTMAMTNPVTIGLFDTAHNLGQYSTAAFDHVQVTFASLGPLPSPWVDQDIGSPTIAGTAGYTNGTFTVNGAGSDIFGSSDQFNFASTSTSVDGSLSARLVSQTNTSSSAKAGVIFRATTDPGSPYYAALVTPGSGVVVQWRSSQGVTTSQSTKVAATLPIYLRITRSGTKFTAFNSTDGVTWTAVPGSSASPAVTGTMLAGLAVTSHNANALGTATFDNVSLPNGSPPPNDFSMSASPGSVSVVQGAAGTSSIGTALVSGSAESVALSISALPAGVSAGFSPTSVTAGGSSSLTLTVGAAVTPGTYPLTVTGTALSATHTTGVSLTVTASTGGGLPSPWADADIGSPAVAGSASYAGGVFTVNGSGTDIYGTSDQFNYVYQPASGNGTLIARVASQTNTGSSNSKAGLIWKASTSSGSPYFLIAVNNSGVVKVQWNFSTSVQSATTYAFPNVWMKMVRSGSTFTAFLSPDGINWSQVASTTLATIPTAATLGLEECSHVNTKIGTATFDNVSFTPGP